MLDIASGGWVIAASRMHKGNWRTKYLNSGVYSVLYTANGGNLSP